MIVRPGWDGVAFSEAADGDLRADTRARRRLSRLLGLDDGWASVSQVHGNRVIRVDSPGDAGTADALWTNVSGLPLAIFTADCFGVTLIADQAVGVAHAGWRGVAAGVVEGLRQAMADAGHEPTRAAIGPGIERCCFEVGPEVAELFGQDVTRTTWGTESVDLRSAVKRQLASLDTWEVTGCTHHEDAWFSHRRDGAPERMASVGWVP